MSKSCSQTYDPKLIGRHGHEDIGMGDASDGSDDVLAGPGLPFG